MKLFSLSLMIGIFIGFLGGIFTEGDFHPDFFVMSTLLSIILLLMIEVKKIPRSKLVDHPKKERKAS